MGRPYFSGACRDKGNQECTMSATGSVQRKLKRDRPQTRTTAKGAVTKGTRQGERHMAPTGSLEKILTDWPVALAGYSIPSGRPGNNSVKILGRNVFDWLPAGQTHQSARRHTHINTFPSSHVIHSLARRCTSRMCYREGPDCAFVHPCAAMWCEILRT